MRRAAVGECLFADRKTKTAAAASRCGEEW